MPSMAAHEAETGAQVEQWHDEAYAEYDEALRAYMAGGICPEGHANPVDHKFCSTCGAALPEHDPATEAAYVEARDNLQAGVRYWRQVGDQVGTRTGILIENNVLPGAEEED